MARRGRPPGIGRDEMLTAALEVLRDRGVARLTTREVAERAGVSEGSIFYHFGDRQALLKAVFEKALLPMVAFRNEIDVSDITDLADVRALLESYTTAVHSFLGDGLDVLIAAHGDSVIRDEVGEFIDTNDYGPHRGVEAITGLIVEAQRAGVVEESVDPATVAHLIVSAFFLRSAQPKLMGHAKGIPTDPDVLDTVMRLLTPAGEAQPSTRSVRA